MRKFVKWLRIPVRLAKACREMNTHWKCCWYEKWVNWSDLIINSIGSFQHEKHKQLNNVDTIIVLRKDQLQHENSGDSDDYIVVNNDTITKLYQRINQLALETAEEQASERFYVNQLAKIKADCTATAKAISTTAVTYLLSTSTPLLFNQSNITEMSISLCRRVAWKMRWSENLVKKSIWMKWKRQFWHDWCAWIVAIRTTANDNPNWCKSFG